MKLWACLFAFACAALAQTYTFLPQGAEVSTAQVGSSIPGEQVLAVIVCGSPQVSGGLIYQQAVAQGYQPISNLFVASVATQVVGKTKLAKIVYILQFATIITAEIASGGAFNIGNKALAGVIFTHGTIDQFSPLLASKIPNAGALLANLVDPSQSYAVSASGCYQGLMLARYLDPGPLQARPPSGRQLSCRRLARRPMLTSIPSKIVTWSG
jgi:hypothetical protein